MNHAARINAMSKSLGVIAFSMALAAAAPAQNVKTCPGVDVLSVEKSTESADSKPATPAEIDLPPKQAPATASGAVERALTVIALGPVLGSMDSMNVNMDFTCTARGILLTATITRSADYKGAALKNVLWRPKLTLALILRQVDVVFESIWVMQLSTGAKVDHAQTPSQPNQKYPITVTRKL